jgi:CRISPR-associated exonuclease Cas4
MTDSTPIPLASLNHYAYCPRRCALIHLEQIWEDNIYTERGTRLHERADTAEYEVQAGVRIERALPLWHDTLGLIGRADIVEFQAGVPYPVEYKAGKRKPSIKLQDGLDLSKYVDDVQLCAQALCLEVMFKQPVNVGAIFHHASRRRREVMFTPELRNLTHQAIEAVRKLIHPPNILTPQLPEAANDARCRHCSLLDACQPANHTARTDPFVLEKNAIPTASATPSQTASETP